MSEVINAIKLKGNNGQLYTLDFDLESVKFAESLGFEWDEMSKKPATMIPILWYSAFRRYHKKVNRKEAEDILVKAGGMNNEMSNRLAELYFQAISGLVETDDEEGEERKNLEWTVEL